MNLTIKIQEKTFENGIDLTLTAEFTGPYSTDSKDLSDSNVFHYVLTYLELHENNKQPTCIQIFNQNKQLIQEFNCQDMAEAWQEMISWINSIQI